MPNWLENILGSIYTRIPKHYRPLLKKVFNFLIIRIQAIFMRHKICKGKRVVFVDYEVADLENFEFLSQGKDEVLVECYKSTISPGTETAVLCGLPGARRRFPYYPGYSSAGIVLKCGKDVTNYKVGDHVAGRVHHMSHETLNPSLLFKIPEKVGFTEASFIELGIITIQGIRKAGIKPGDIVVIVGQGLIGQISNKICKMLGASKVIAIASSNNREKTALSNDAADEFYSLSEVPKEIDADVVIEAVGSPTAVVTALKFVRNGGKLVLLGSSRGMGRDVNWYKLAQIKNVKVIGAHISDLPEHDTSFERWTYQKEGLLFLDLLNSGRLNISNLVTWMAEPIECNKVYEILANGGGEHVGIIFNWKR